ncbi:sialate O-acetylesterase [Pontibacter sp. H249]|uniref:sialate O-acetylesterase n=1 Tax=Pontibacter sp. H249 TaxID=3133420 RepID=UPI0030C2EF80
MVQGYNFYENLGSGFIKLNAELLAEPSFTRTGLVASTSGNCYFTAVDDSGNESAPGQAASFTTLEAQPEQEQYSYFAQGFNQAGTEVLGTDVNLQLVDSNCLEITTATTFNVAGLVSTDTIEVASGSIMPTYSADGVLAVGTGKLYGLKITHTGEATPFVNCPVAEGFGAVLYNIANSQLPLFIPANTSVWAKQDNYHYNLTKGCSKKLAMGKTEARLTGLSLPTGFTVELWFEHLGDLKAKIAAAANYLILNSNIAGGSMMHFNSNQLRLRITGSAWNYFTVGANAKQGVNHLLAYIDFTTAGNSKAVLNGVNLVSASQNPAANAAPTQLWVGAANNSANDTIYHRLRVFSGNKTTEAASLFNNGVFNSAYTTDLLYDFSTDEVGVKSHTSGYGDLRLREGSGKPTRRGFVYIPAKDTQATASGFSLTNPSGSYHNGSETKFKRNSAANDVLNFFADANGTAIARHVDELHYNHPFGAEKNRLLKKVVGNSVTLDLYSQPATAGQVAATGIPANIAPIVLLIGQSNALGWDNKNNYAAEYKTTFDNIKIWDIEKGGGFVPLNFSTTNNQQPAGSANLRMGLETPLMKRLADLTGKELYLIKYALDGSSLADQWRPQIVNWNTGYHTEKMLQAVQAAKAALIAAGKLPKIICVVMFQGENDADTQADKDAYYANLKELIYLTREEELNHALPWIDVLINANLSSSSYPYTADIRAIKTQVAAEDKHYKTLDSTPIYQAAGTPNDTHMNAAGYTALGIDLAERIYSGELIR